MWSVSDQPVLGLKTTTRKRNIKIMAGVQIEKPAFQCLNVIACCTMYCVSWVCEQMT